jgi:hypothetical protein
MVDGCIVGEVDGCVEGVMLGRDVGWEEGVTEG